MTKNAFALLFAASVMAPACTDQIQTPESTPPPGSTSGNQGTTFDHANDQIDPFDLLQRLVEQGPPRYTSHVHSCSKVRYATLGNVLASVGMNPANTVNLSAGQLYTSGFNALGGPNYANRIRENVLVSTSGASREFDIFAAGATETIATLAANNTFARCPGVQVFDTTTTPATCRVDGITCIIGFPATATHVSLCNLTVQNASDPTEGQKLAVAAMLAAAYTCE
jgi:hypothetical protein